MAIKREIEKAVQTILYGRNFHNFDLSTRIDEATYRAAEHMNKSSADEVARYTRQQRVKNFLDTLAVNLESDLPKVSPYPNKPHTLDNLMDFDDISFQDVRDRINTSSEEIQYFTEDMKSGLMLILIQRGKNLAQGVRRAAVVSHALNRAPLEAIQYSYQTSDIDASHSLIQGIKEDYQDINKNLSCIIDYDKRTRKSLRGAMVIPFSYISSLAKTRTNLIRLDKLQILRKKYSEDCGCGSEHKFTVSLSDNEERNNPHLPGMGRE